MLRKQLKRFSKSKLGATAIEYGLIAAGVGIVMSVAMAALGPKNLAAMIPIYLENLACCDYTIYLNNKKSTATSKFGTASSTYLNE